MNSAWNQYRGEKGADYHQTKRAIPEPAYPWVAKMRATKFAAFIQEKDQVLEYGVGFGWNLALLRCRRKLGYDPSECLAPVLAAHGIEFIPQTRSLPAGSVDVVICHHALEHCLNPVQELEEIFRLLISGGRLLLVVPYETERRLRRYLPDEPNHHLYAWSAQSLGNLVSAVGFTSVQAKVQIYGYDRFAAVWAHRLRVGEIGFKFLTKTARLLFPLREVILTAKKGTD